MYVRTLKIFQYGAESGGGGIPKGEYCAWFFSRAPIILKYVLSTQFLLTRFLPPFVLISLSMIWGLQRLFLIMRLPSQVFLKRDLKKNIMLSSEWIRYTSCIYQKKICVLCEQGEGVFYIK